MKLIDRLRHWWELHQWIAIVAWRHVTGRYYIFRDAPEHVLGVFASFADNDQANDEMKELGRQALDEIKLRINLILRKHGIEERV